MTDEWDDSPYEGWGVDEPEVDLDSLNKAIYASATAEEIAQDAAHLAREYRNRDDWGDRLTLSYRLSYWFWLNVYRLKRRLGLGV